MDDKHSSSPCSVLVSAKLVPVGYGIKKLTIMMTIVDDLVSPDNIIEDHLTTGEAAEYIQSCDIVAFNKICKWMPPAARSVGSADVSAPLLCPQSQKAKFGVSLAHAFFLSYFLVLCVQKSWHYFQE